jgi:hypothetical protein
MNLSIEDVSDQTYLYGQPVDAVYADEEGHLVEILLKDKEGKPIFSPGSTLPLSAPVYGDVELRRVRSG